MTESTDRKGIQGFASMNPNKQRAIASAGGKASHAKGVAHEFTAEEATAAGRKGGAKVSKDRAHMAEIGRKGGLARGRQKTNEKKEMESKLDAHADGVAYVQTISV